MRSPGDRVHRYTIVALIGRGGMGEIYEATDTLLERTVALKLIPGRGDADARERMLREARAAAAFQHPNIVTVFDAGVVDEGTEQEETFMAMELLRGRTLRHVIDAGDASLDVRLGWLRTLASALAAAHQAGLVHRDIKPDNVMVTRAGTLKVLDFGIAKRAPAPIDPSAPTETPAATPATLTQKGSFVGTPRYAPPEQLRGEDVDGRSDQYSFGATAFELLTGRPPFDAEGAVALLSRILSEAPPAPRDVQPDVPGDVSDTIVRCLAKEREARFPDMREVAAAFPIVGDTERGGTPASESGGARASPSRRPPAPSSASRAATANVTAVDKPALPRRIGGWIVRGVLGFAALIGLIILGAIAFGALTGNLQVRGLGSDAPSGAPAERPPPAGIRCQVADAPNHAMLASDEPGRSAIGIGACVRLAVELGLPWGHEKARDRGADLASFTPLVVTVAPDGEVTISLDGVEARAHEVSPIRSAERAVQELAKVVPPAPCTEVDRAAWGAGDDASARRIERVWRKLVIGALDNAEETARKLTETDPESPFPHAILALVTPRGSAHGRAAATALRERLGKLPPARAKALDALAILVAEPARLDEAIKLLRQSYRDAPNDADVAGLYAAVVLDTSGAEGLAVIERISTDFPTLAHLPLTNAVGTTVRDRARNMKFLARLVEIQPEKACENIQFNELVYDGDVPELRARLARCKALFGEDSGVFIAPLFEGAIEIAALEPARARAAASKLLGDPRETVRNEAARIVIGSHVLAGQMREAKKALIADMERLRDEESPRTALDRGLAYLRLQRLLGEPADPAVMAEVAKLRALDADLPKNAVARVDALLLSFPSGDPKRSAAVAAELIESKSPGDAAFAVPLLRRVKGSREALALGRPSESAGTRVGVVTALDVALAMIDAGETDEAIDAQLRTAMIPIRVDMTGFDKIAARVILERRLSARGDASGAASLRAEIDKAWVDADAGLRAIAQNLH